MKKTKDYIIGVVILLITMILAAAIPTEAEAAIYDDTLRLHILANSDSEEDQALKLRLRDRLLTKYGAHLAAADGKDEATEQVTALLPSIEEDVSLWIAEEGYSYPVTVTLTEEWYDTREYDGFTLPKGEYTSLRILIGEAQGQNWWCVMFPPLCLDIATEDAPRDDAVVDYTKEETKLVTSGGYTIKFKLLEFLCEILPRF